ncbi:hypothetical protein ACFT5B_02795 [Luteimicrobium sp. NPDC057192]|uniref:hypothetical protein n=1 Tax=Luteimicrobium sp. NPDC057192 TaxID=3346042 RepID=UPI0036333B68
MRAARSLVATALVVSAMMLAGCTGPGAPRLHATATAATSAKPLLGWIEAYTSDEDAHDRTVDAHIDLLRALADLADCRADRGGSDTDPADDDPCYPQRESVRILRARVAYHESATKPLCSAEVAAAQPGMCATPAADS